MVEYRDGVSIRIKMPEINVKEYEKRCQELLEDEEVRFAGLG